ncbi:MAG: hypothetical protein HFG42_11470 [Lachnospiraceae bacterium]|nr:hypothetical protein [Lachnospiraceae bacterium]
MKGIELILQVSHMRYQVKRAQIFQKLNDHSRLEVTLSMKGGDETGGGFECLAPVQLMMISEEEKVIFSGIIVKTVRYRKDGQLYQDMTISSYSLLFDLERKSRSFQKESRTYGELFQLILAGYPSGAYIWNGEEKGMPVNEFLFQYQESDWEFLRRLASRHHKALIPEITVPGPKFYVGLLKRPEQEVSGDTVRRNLDFHKTEIRIKNTSEEAGGLSVRDGKEYRIYGAAREIELGAPVFYMGESLIAAQVNAGLINGEWQYEYVLKTPEACKTGLLKNENLRGTSVSGTVINSRLGQVQLKLQTDKEETVESWHIQPAYYAGTGRGYGGRPEPGDTLQLYFASDTEAERYIIGSASASPEKLNQIVNAAGEKAEPLPKTKCLTTAADLGAVLDGNGVWIHSKGQTAKITVTRDKISLYSKGDVNLCAENIKGTAGEISLTARDYVWMHSGEKGILLTEDQLHMKDSEINIFSPLNEECEIPDQDAVNVMLTAFEEKRKSGAEFFMADGSLHRLGGPETEEEKNIRMVLDHLQGIKDPDVELEVEEYHVYSLGEIDELRRKEKLLFIARGKISGVGDGLKLISELVDSNTYGSNTGWLDKPIWEGIPKDFLMEKLEDGMEEYEKNRILQQSKHMGVGEKYIKGADWAYGFVNDIQEIQEALYGELPDGNLLAIEYTPFHGKGENYTNNNIYYLKPNDVKLTIFEKNDKGYTGQYVVALSKDMQGDPMEIKALWYYKQ